MRAILLHNPDAGGGDDGPDTLVRLLERTGLTVVCRPAKDAASLHEPADLVVAAGGDGTVARTLATLPDRRVPVLVLPQGTANNIAGALGIEGPPERLIAGWREARVQPVDIGVAAGPWGRRRFLEGAGIGAFVRAGCAAEASEAPAADRFRSARETFAQELARAEPDRIEASLDGAPLPGEVLLLEAVSLGWVGPRLRLAPHAYAADGKLDVVCVEPGQRRAVLDWLGEKETPPPVTLRRGRRLELAWEGRLALHLDDEFFAPPGHPSRIELAFEPEQARVLVPDTKGGEG
jgi:diacylglycerol kinase family enzyme